ncbi:TIGR01621 family pseudouridine synthase [Lacimicrobium sp. SS2-24]|uniref:TIGR01621 family pseudouridine synthase n=1 Tax=Lacimicrobium sp. SS2-24 TaxID=2005569 RepID=UPI000B4B3390|nr:TIGR01621 family pseudouridine synthase [Lacimicrobium sp. SS2-24]
MTSPLSQHPIPVIYEDEDMLVIHKPPGVGMHQEGDTPGIVTLLAHQQKNAPYLVHRLDKVTSGLLMLAKHRQSAQRLSQHFARREIDKYYLAITDSRPAKKQGCVYGDMQKARGGAWMLTKTRRSPAVTQFFSCAASAGQRLILLKPHTGKTHQLRVMLKSLGSPILGDALYKGTAADRTYLHAFALRFSSDAKDYQFVLPPERGSAFLNQACEQAISAYTPPWQLNWPTLPKSATTASVTGNAL